MVEHQYEVQWWNNNHGHWETDFTSDDLQHIQRVLTGRQKPLQNKLRIRKIEDITRFFDL